MPPKDVNKAARMGHRTPSETWALGNQESPSKEPEFVACPRVGLGSGPFTLNIALYSCLGETTWMQLEHLPVAQCI